MSAKTIGICPEEYGYTINPFKELFPNSVVLSEYPDKYSYPLGLDAVLFLGGRDIHPSLYHEEAHPLNQAPKDGPSQRDWRETNWFDVCRFSGIPMIGICRGAQLLCALNGGKLIQHVDGHHGDHWMFTKDEQRIKTNSVHHQMMFPEGHYEVITHATRSAIYHGAKDNEFREDMESRDFKEPEIVWWPETKSLGIQGHPEYGDAPEEFVAYCKKLIQERILK